MAFQWTVSFEKNELSKKALKLLESFDYEAIGESRIDMQEGEFFSFEAEALERGMKIPVDGSNSWGKQVKC